MVRNVEGGTAAKPSRHVTEADKSDINESIGLQKVKSKRIASYEETGILGIKGQTAKRTTVKERGLRSESPKKSIAGMGGFKKKYTASYVSCNVTFRLPKAAVGPAKKVTIVGDFNNWDARACPMKRLRNGDFQVTLELPSQSEYKFRYLINESHWENDWCADKYVPNPFGCDDSVVIT
jgi:hypothetical protein